MFTAVVHVNSDIDVVQRIGDYQWRNALVQTIESRTVRLLIGASSLRRMGRLLIERPVSI